MPIILASAYSDGLALQFRVEEHFNRGIKTVRITMQDNTVVQIISTSLMMLNISLQRLLTFNHTFAIMRMWLNITFRIIARLNIIVNTIE